MLFRMRKQVVDANDNSVASVINVTPGEWAMMPSSVQVACVFAHWRKAGDDELE